MANKKEWYMDYATHAFVRYANLGCPTRAEYTEKINQDCYQKHALLEPGVIGAKAEAAVYANEPLLNDIDAVNRVFDILEKQHHQEIAAAIRYVYFTDPLSKPRRGAIIARVRRFAYECPADERTVYRWLKSARVLFCKERGLDTGSEGERW